MEFKLHEQFSNICKQTRHLKISIYDLFIIQLPIQTFFIIKHTHEIQQVFQILYTWLGKAYEKFRECT